MDLIQEKILIKSLISNVKGFVKIKKCKYFGIISLVLVKKEVQSIGNTNFSTQNNPIAFFVICYLNGDKFWTYDVLKFYYKF